MLAFNQVRILAASLLAASALCALPAQAVPFQNGSFETGTAPGGFTQLPAGNANITGWVIAAGGVDYIGSYWQAAEGNRSLDLNRLAAGEVNQEFDTVVGQRYRVTYAIAGNPDGGPTIKSLKVLADGVEIDAESFDITGKTRPSMGWVDVSVEFFADEVLTTLAFVSTTTAPSGNTSFPHAFGPALDNVCIVAVAEPTTLLLFTAGLLGLGLARRRRND